MNRLIVIILVVLIEVVAEVEVGGQSTRWLHNIVCTNPQTEPDEGADESSVKNELDFKKQLFNDAETNTVSSSGLLQSKYCAKVTFKTQLMYV